MFKYIYNISIFLSGLVVYSMAATTMQTKDKVDGNWLVIDGKKRFLQGMNIAWITNNTFGNDVGDAKININMFTSHIKKIRKVGGNAVRWWLHTDASHCPKIDASGAVTGIGKRTISNMKQALDTAHAYGVVISMCLFSFDLLQKGTKSSYSDYNFDNNLKFLTVPENIDTYLEKGLKPILEGVGDHPAIMCWEVFNEPEGMIEGHGWTPTKIDAKHVQRITNKIAGCVHDHSNKMVSTGVHCADDLALYKDAALKAAGGIANGTLDFIQLHYYPEWFGQDHSPVHNPKSFWKDKWEDRPVLIGEFPAKDWSTSTTGTSSGQPLKTSKKIVDAFKYAYDEGYAGAMSWTMVTDAKQAAFFGSYETTAPALKALYDAHKRDIEINSVSIEEMKGDYALKLDLQNLQVPSGNKGYQELGTSFSKNFTGKKNILFEMYVTANSGDNAKVVVVIKVGSSYKWSPAQSETIMLGSVEKGKWVTYSIPVSAFGAHDLSDVREILFQYWAEGSPYTGTFFFDNVRADKDTLANFNTEGSAWGTTADEANVALVKLSEVTSFKNSVRISTAAKVKTVISFQGKTVRFKVSEYADVRIELVDIRGKVVSKVNYGRLDSGIHTFLFDNVSSGHYICNIFQNNKLISADVILW